MERCGADSCEEGAEGAGGPGAEPAPVRPRPPRGPAPAWAAWALWARLGAALLLSSGKRCGECFCCVSMLAARG